MQFCTSYHLAWARVLQELGLDDIRTAARPVPRPLPQDSDMAESGVLSFDCMYLVVLAALNLVSVFAAADN